jgi:hypothetical protein
MPEPQNLLSQPTHDAKHLKHALGFDQPDQIAISIQASLIKGRPCLFDTGGLCAGYPLEPSPDAYFVAHEASPEKIADLRHALEQGLANARLKPYTADQDTRFSYILCKIAALRRSETGLRAISGCPPIPHTPLP